MNSAVLVSSRSWVRRAWRQFQRRQVTPGLPGDPGHQTAAAQMTGFGAVLAFEVADAPGTTSTPRSGTHRHGATRYRTTRPEPAGCQVPGPQPQRVAGVCGALHQATGPQNNLICESHPLPDRASDSIHRRLGERSR
jgi:hypothetical protein